MRTRAEIPYAAQAISIPLLDASSLPSADDWALLESIATDASTRGEFEPAFDRFGRVRLSASYDE
jgi:hypothetical protein